MDSAYLIAIITGIIAGILGLLQLLLDSRIGKRLVSFLSAPHVIIMAAILGGLTAITAILIQTRLLDSSLDSNAVEAAVSATLTAIYTTAQPVSSLSGVIFDFEVGTDNWTTSEGSFKLAGLTTTTEPVLSGNQALELRTELSGGGDDVFSHTEATAYFDRAIPLNLGRPGPYDLRGRRISCFVFFPDSFPTDGSDLATVRVFVKDNSFRNSFGEPFAIRRSALGGWQEIFLVVGRDFYTDANFDGTMVSAFGVRIDTPNSTSFEYTGSIYIDKCEIR